MYKRLLVLGDSHTQLGAAPGGWVNLVSHHFCRQLDITNRGLSGYTTRWCVQFLSTILSSEQRPHYAVVCFGSNDAADPSHPQHVPVKEYGDNLSVIVDRLTGGAGVISDNILLLTPPCVDEAMYRTHFDNDSRRNVNLQRYVDEVLRVAHEKGCVTGNLFTVFTAGGNSLLCDGLHFSQSGNRVVADLVIEFLESRLGGEFPLPPYRDLMDL